MATRACLSLIVLFLAVPVDFETPNRWIFWNVGQGLWITRVESGECRHFDMGGERAPWSDIMRVCRGRRNSVLISHWDWDHIGLIGRARYFLPNLCREELPGGNPSARKRAVIERVGVCTRATPFQVWRPDLAQARTENDFSAIVHWRGLLLPGDSSKKMEKIWIYEHSNLNAVRLLALGHHGSRTSTSKILLNELPNLRLAVASARRRRYGHPHRDTVEALAKFKVPWLGTEEWGIIVIW